MKITTTLICVMFSVSLVRAQSRTPESLTDEQVTQLIEQVEQTPVSRLDHSLPSVSFAEWLKAQVGGDAKIGWALRYPDGASADYEHLPPPCVEADVVTKDGRSITVFIAVGTPRLVGKRKPYFLRVELGRIKDLIPSDSDKHPYWITLRRLSDLPSTLEKPDGELEALDSEVPGEGQR